MRPYYLKADDEDTSTVAIKSTTTDTVGETVTYRVKFTVLSRDNTITRASCSRIPW